MAKWLIKTSLLMLLLNSCSATWHLNKAIKKDPTILEKDTVTVVDTVVTAPVEIKDTMVLEDRDTIVVVKDRLKLQLVRSFDTIAVEAECASDTIISTIEVPVEKIVYVKKKSLSQQIKDYLLAAMFIVSVYLVIKIYKEFNA